MGLDVMFNNSLREMPSESSSPKQHFILYPHSQDRLLSQDFGKHLLEVEDLLQKHALVEADIAMQADRVRSTNAAALKFANGDSECRDAKTSTTSQLLHETIGNNLMGASGHSWQWRFLDGPRLNLRPWGSSIVFTAELKEQAKFNFEQVLHTNDIKCNFVSPVFLLPFMHLVLGGKIFCFITCQNHVLM